MTGPKPLPLTPALAPKKPVPVPPSAPPRKPVPEPPRGLIAEMEHRHRQGTPVGVLLIDEDERDDGAVYGETAAQRTVLEHAFRLGLKVFIVEINTELKHDPRSHTIGTRQEFVKYAHRILNKREFNAFDADTYPNLQTTLDAAGLPAETSSLVVMGFAANQCVRLTAVGGQDRPSGPHKDGATQRGYTVLSCLQVLRGGAPSWTNARGVVFLDDL